MTSMRHLDNYMPPRPIYHWSEKYVFFILFCFVFSMKVYAKEQGIQDSIAIMDSTPITKTQIDKMRRKLILKLNL